MKICETIISDPKLAWTSSLEKQSDKFFITLSKNALSELEHKKNSLETCEIDNFPILKKEILELKNQCLINGNGFFIINGSSFYNFDDVNIKEIFRIISTCLGKLYIQNIKQEKFVIITDEGKSMKTGGRYHETKEGGSHHTDSPQWKNVPDWLGLFCVHNAKKGGTNLFLSAYTIHNMILKERKDLLNFLYEKFHFDKRGEFKDGESPTVFEPIFEYKEGKLRFRYLRNYIDAGHNVQNQPLSKSQKEALSFLDGLMQDENIVLGYNLKPGDMVFSDNHWILHGRTSFEDHDDKNLKREMLRTWVKDRMS